MFNPLITPEIALMLKRGEVRSSEIDIEHNDGDFELEALMLQDADDLMEHLARWDEVGFTVGDEPEDIASETEPTIFDKFMPNDGTPAIEHRLRKQGFKKASDDEREEVQELYVEVSVLANKRVGRLHILRQKGGDILI